MNKSNLQLMADHIKTIPQEVFDMQDYRKNNLLSIECGSIGCDIGHCIQLDPDSKNVPINKHFETIDFFKWSENFTELDGNSDEWNWCFDSRWKSTDNTPLGASKRIEYLINNGLPENLRNQMFGYMKLCYL